MTDPEVTVIVEQINSQKYNIFGQVGKPGCLLDYCRHNRSWTPLRPPADFATSPKRSPSTFFARASGGGEARFNFNYEKFIKGKDPTQNILLKPHDTIVVP